MANLNKTSPLNVKVGDTIRYQVKDLNDTVVYSGNVVSICDYMSARSYGDVAAIHQAMLAADSTIDDASNLRYIIVECYDGIRRPVGFQTDGKNSWLIENVVNIVEIGQEYKIRLFNCSSADASIALSLLRENGFSCKLIME